MDCICDDQLREIKSTKGTLHLGAHGSTWHQGSPLGSTHCSQNAAQLHGIRAFLEPQVGLDEGAMGLPDFSSAMGRKWCLGSTAVDWVFRQLSGYPGPSGSRHCKGQCPRAAVRAPQ